MVSGCEAIDRPARDGSPLAAFAARWRAGFAAAILGIVAGCASAPSGTGGVGRPAISVSEAAAIDPVATPVVQRARSRWVAVSWSELPGWESDALGEWWPAFVAGCARPAAAWSTLCAQALLQAPAADAAAQRAWLQQRVAPWRVESLPDEAVDPATGLLTGYLEPVIAARRRPSGEFQTPLFAAPADLAQRRPYWSRQELDTLPVARAALRGREIAYVADPLDALFVQIQGSARLAIRDDAGNAPPAVVRLGFAGHNDQPYRSVGRWLIEQGELRPTEASWPAIKAWAQRNPKRVPEMLWSNPRVVFFREEPLPDPSVGPRGAQGVPLTPLRSIAVDPLSVPYGTPVWIDSTEPLGSAPLRRLTMAQDTGSAITGAVRADFFWGWGEAAEANAGRMRQPLRKWALWPLPAR